ncbi:MAG: 50S ribosomal protein L32e [Candidatus Thorarchaeota archaeon]
MSKKPQLGDVPGIGPKMEEKLREAGVKTPASLSKAKPEKLAEKVDGLSVAGAEKIIEAAKELVSAKPTKKETKPKKTAEKKEAKPAAKPKTKPKKDKEPSKPKAKPKKEAKAEAPKTKKKAEEKPKEKKAAPKKKEPAPKKKKKKPDFDIKKREIPYDQRLFSVAQAKKKRKPSFRHEQAHRWIRVSDSWRKVRGIDSATRVKSKGRIAMVSAGYRSPKAVRGLHPSGYEEAMVSRPSDLDGLDPNTHAIRIASTVGMKKRQDILDKAEMGMFKVLNPGAPESVVEEDLFEELEGLDDLEVD